MTEELPDGWVRSTLGELGVEAQPGFASGKHNSSGEGILHLRPMNVTREGLISTTDARYVEDGSDRRVQAGDILFNNTNSPALTGKTALVTLSEPVGYSNHMTRLRTPDGINAGFLAAQLHWLWRSGYFQSVLNNHVNQASVATKQLMLTPVVVPPSSEQRRIIAALDERLSRLNASKELLAAAIVRCHALDKALVDRAVSGSLVEPPSVNADIEGELAAIFEERKQRVSRRRAIPVTPAVPIGITLPKGWQTLPMDAVTWSIEYGTSAKAHADKVQDDVPVLRMGNIQSRKIDASSLKYLPAGHPDLAKLNLEPGDLLFNRTNSAELVGKSAVYDGVPAPATFASYLIRCRFVPGIEPGWVNLVVNSPMGRNYLMSVVTQQVGQANINGSKLAAMPLPIPPLAEQRQILAELDKALSICQRLEARAHMVAAHADQLRRSLLAAAFSGRLTQQGADDEPASELLGRIKAERPEAKRPMPTRRVSANKVAQSAAIQEELPL